MNELVQFPAEPLLHVLQLPHKIRVSPAFNLFDPVTNKAHTFDLRVDICCPFWAAVGGGTYVHDIRGGVAFGAEFPGSDVHMHEPDERVEIRELMLAGQMFAQAVARFCQ